MATRSSLAVFALNLIVYPIVVVADFDWLVFAAEAAKPTGQPFELDCCPDV